MDQHCQVVHDPGDVQNQTDSCDEIQPKEKAVFKVIDDAGLNKELKGKQK